MIGFIGCGNMGSAMVEGIITGRLRKSVEIIVYDHDISRTESLKERFGLKVAADPLSLLRESSEVFLSVKPQEMGGLLQTIKPLLRPEHLLITVAAGLNISFYEKYLGKEQSVVRLMPNTPCLVGEGMIVVCSNKNVESWQEQLIIKLLKPLGKVIVLEEKHFDAVTALSGSGPAYIFLVIESLADGAVEMGLSRDVALMLASQTVFGAAKMCLDSGENPSILKNRITSPAGTTSAALMALEEGAVRSLFAKAVAAATHRSKEMGSNMDLNGN